MKGRNRRARIACECGCGVCMDISHAEYMRLIRPGVLVVLGLHAGERRVLSRKRDWAVVSASLVEAREVAA